MQRSKRIVLPLALGLASLSQPPLEIINSAAMELQLEVPCKVLRGMYCQGEGRVAVREARHEGERVLAKCGESGKGECEKGVGMGQSSQLQASKLSLPPFEVSFLRNGEQLSITLAKQLLSFSLHPVPKSKFVKSEKLSQILNQQREQCGPLSMDKSQRILLQPDNTPFPVIGLWISSHQPLSNSKNLCRLITHIHNKHNKIFFAHQGRSFFYLARLNFLKNLPELYLVEWKGEGDCERTVRVCKKDAFTKAEITVSSDEQSNLEFTLRSDEKVPQTLLNIACSPIKFPSCSYDETKSSTQDSPRFKLDRSEMAEQECASLRRLVKSQEIEIIDLRAEILRLSGELRQCKRHRHYCESEEMSSSHVSSFREEGRRLTRSDLNYDSPSPCNEQHEQTHCKGGQQQNVWDRFQLVEK